METFTNSLVEAIFSIVGILLAAGVSYFMPKVKRWLDKLGDKDNLGIINEIVDMGVEFAEKEFSGKEGQEKFNQAAQYVAKMAHRYGIDVSDDFISGAVQRGYKRMIQNDRNSQKEGAK